MDFLEEIKSIPISDYAEKIGFSTVKKGKYISLKEHDSVMIDTEKNCFWRNSKFVSGKKGGSGTIIDFAIEFGGASDCKEAIKQINYYYNISSKSNSCPVIKIPQKPNNKTIVKLEYPKKAFSNENAFNYLFIERNINRSVLRYFFNKKLLYEDVYQNCVFATSDFCCVRGTKKRFVKDLPGCNYNECFYVPCKNNNDTLIVAESVIDIMSIMSYFCVKNKRFTDFDFLALSGTNKLMSVKYHILKNPNYKNVCLCYDNDDGGNNAILATKESLSSTNIRISIVQPPSEFNDWNDYLVKKFPHREEI